MLKSIAAYAQAVALIAVVAVPLHFLAGLDWPWAVVAGGLAAIVLRPLIRRARIASDGRPIAGSRP